MRILIVTDTYPPAQDGHAVSVSWWERHLSKAGIDVVVSTPNRMKLFPKNIDVVFLHGYGLRAAAVIATVPDVPIVSFVHRITYLDVPEILPRVPWLQTAATQYLHSRQQRFLRYSAHVVAPSEHTAQFVRQMAPDVPVSVIPTGVHEAFYDACGTANHTGRPVVLYLGRRSRDKGFADLVPLATQQPGWTWSAIGAAGPDDDAARAAGFELFPHTDQANVIANLQRASVLVLPSTRETQGLVATEALTVGVPVVAPSGSAQAEVIIPGENGETYEHNGLLEAITRAMALGPLTASAAALGAEKLTQRMVHVLEQAKMFRSG